jgi:hypothetical protein
MGMLTRLEPGISIPWLQTSQPIFDLEGVSFFFNQSGGISWRRYLCEKRLFAQIEAKDAVTEYEDAATP